MFTKIHHTAIICSDYRRSKDFYTKSLGLDPIRETYRADRDSYKLDLALNGEYVIELFSFPNVPARPTMPEATGLRHLAFAVANLNQVIETLQSKNVFAEKIRYDEATGKHFAFIFDPDLLPIELYEL